ncbi:MAG: FecR family protein [Mangrovibacterium sp.]
MDQKLSLLKRFFQNRYSRNDYQELKKLLSARDPELGVLMQLHWDEFRSGLKQHKDLSPVFEAINRELDKKTTVFPFRKWTQYWSRIAAILLLPLLLGSVFLYMQFRSYLSQQDVFVEVTSPAGSRTMFNLPDGSTVWLNGNSQIRYPAVFNENRKVEITGEAFFKVESDRENPFFVEAKDLFVRATGTEFNVLAYPDEAAVSVILKEGKVTVLDNRQSVLQEMTTGYLYQYDGQTVAGKYVEVDAENYAGWINGKLIFENATMEEVVRRMEHWYGVSIEIADKELLKLHFKATFINESIEEALKLLQSTATFNYRFIDRQIKADGSLEEAKIVMSRE